MVFVLCLAFIFCLLIFPFLRCLIFNLHNVFVYTPYDLFNYFRYQRWKDFNYFGIKMYVGMFGHGKTLSMTHEVINLYKKYGDSIRIISNYKLVNIPYIPLVNFQQLIDIGEEEDDNYIGTVVLIDEVESLLSHRNFSSFPLSLLHLLCQQRKKRVYILCSSQRFHMVDRIFRSITTYVVDCSKYWRFCRTSFFDAWEYENCLNPTLIKPFNVRWWFVHNKDFNAYDTSQMITKTAAEEFISNDEKLARLGEVQHVEDGFKHRKRRKRKELRG